MRVFDAESLKQEKIRLRTKVMEHERSLHTQLVGAEQSIAPFARFFFPKAANPTGTVPIQEDWFHKGIKIITPFLVDRLTLGTKGLLLNRGLNAAIQFIAGKIPSEKLTEQVKNWLAGTLNRIGTSKRKPKS